MKVVLFCGGLGMRLRDYSDFVPKPLIPVAGRPLVWHLMRYYAHYGHREFILCLGYGGEAIRRFFDEARLGSPLAEESAEWRVTLLDTGLDASIGERLVAARHHLQGDRVFLANYADGLTDCPLPDLTAFAERRRTVATFLSVRPNLSVHEVVADRQGMVREVRDVADSGLRINGGFFVLRREIFGYMRPGEDLVREPFQRLIQRRMLSAYRYDGFWHSVDTAKDKLHVDQLATADPMPWQPWRAPARVALG